MPKTSAGLLMYKIKKASSLTSVNEEKGKLMVFLVHPGGPFWEHKDKGVWGIPKGEQDDEKHELADVAKREFSEETGIVLKENIEFILLGSIRQKNGKIVHAWAFENNEDFEFKCHSYVEKAEFADKSEENIVFPEVDKGEFFDIEEAREKMLPSQWELVERLMKELKIDNEKEFKQKTLF